MYDKTSTLQYNKYTVWKSKIKYHDPKIKQTLRASTSLDKKKTPNDKMIVFLLTSKVIYMKSMIKLKSLKRWIDNLSGTSALSITGTLQI